MSPQLSAQELDDLLDSNGWFSSQGFVRHTKNCCSWKSCRYPVRRRYDQDRERFGSTTLSTIIAATQIQGIKISFALPKGQEDYRNIYLKTQEALSVPRRLAEEGFLPSFNWQPTSTQDHISKEAAKDLSIGFEAWLTQISGESLPEFDDLPIGKLRHLTGTFVMEVRFNEVLVSAGTVVISNNYLSGKNIAWERTFLLNFRPINPLSGIAEKSEDQKCQAIYDGATNTSDHLPREEVATLRPLLPGQR